MGFEWYWILLPAGWALGLLCGLGVRQRQRRASRLEREWENLFSYDGQKQEGCK